MSGATVTPGSGSHKLGGGHHDHVHTKPSGKQSLHGVSGFGTDSGPLLAQIINKLESPDEYGEISAHDFQNGLASFETMTGPSPEAALDFLVKVLTLIDDSSFDYSTYSEIAQELVHYLTAAAPLFIAGSENLLPSRFGPQLTKPSGKGASSSPMIAHVVTNMLYSAKRGNINHTEALQSLASSKAFKVPDLIATVRNKSTNRDNSIPVFFLTDKKVGGNTFLSLVPISDMSQIATDIRKVSHTGAANSLIDLSSRLIGTFKGESAFTNKSNLKISDGSTIQEVTIDPNLASAEEWLRDAQSEVAALNIANADPGFMNVQTALDTLIKTYQTETTVDPSHINTPKSQSTMGYIQMVDAVNKLAQQVQIEIPEIQALVADLANPSALDSITADDFLARLLELRGILETLNTERFTTLFSRNEDYQTYVMLLASLECVPISDPKQLEKGGIVDKIIKSTIIPTPLKAELLIRVFSNVRFSDQRDPGSLATNLGKRITEANTNVLRKLQYSHDKESTYVRLYNALSNQQMLASKLLHVSDQHQQRQKQALAAVTHESLKPQIDQYKATLGGQKKNSVWKALVRTPFLTAETSWGSTKSTQKKAFPQIERTQGVQLIHSALISAYLGVQIPTPTPTNINNFINAQPQDKQDDLRTHIEALRPFAEHLHITLTSGFQSERSRQSQACKTTLARACQEVRSGARLHASEPVIKFTKNDRGLVYLRKLGKDQSTPVGVLLAKGVQKASPVTKQFVTESITITPVTQAPIANISSITDPNTNLIDHAAAMMLQVRTELSATPTGEAIVAAARFRQAENLLQDLNAADPKAENTGYIRTKYMELHNILHQLPGKVANKDAQWLDSDGSVPAFTVSGASSRSASTSPITYRTSVPSLNLSAIHQLAAQKTEAETLLAQLKTTQLATINERALKIAEIASANETSRQTLEAEITRLTTADPAANKDEIDELTARKDKLAQTLQVAEDSLTAFRTSIEEQIARQEQVVDDLTTRSSRVASPSSPSPGLGSIPSPLTSPLFNATNQVDPTELQKLIAGTDYAGIPSEASAILKQEKNGDPLVDATALARAKSLHTALIPLLAPFTAKASVSQQERRDNRFLFEAIRNITAFDPSLEEHVKASELSVPARPPRPTGIVILDGTGSKTFGRASKIIGITKGGNCLYESFIVGQDHAKADGDNSAAIATLRTQVKDIIKDPRHANLLTSYKQDVRTHVYDILDLNRHPDSWSQSFGQDLLSVRLNALIHNGSPDIRFGATQNTAGEDIYEFRRANGTWGTISNLDTGAAGETPGDRQKAILDLIVNDDFVTAAVDSIDDNRTWGGQVELEALSEIAKGNDIEIVVYTKSRRAPVIRNNRTYGQKGGATVVHLVHNGRDHYDIFESVTPTTIKPITDLGSMSEENLTTELAKVDISGLVAMADTVLASDEAGQIEKDLAARVKNESGLRAHAKATLIVPIFFDDNGQLSETAKKEIQSRNLDLISASAIILDPTRSIDLFSQDQEEQILLQNRARLIQNEAVQLFDEALRWQGLSVAILEANPDFGTSLDPTAFNDVVSLIPVLPLPADTLGRLQSTAFAYPLTREDAVYLSDTRFANLATDKATADALANIPGNADEKRARYSTLVNEALFILRFQADLEAFNEPQFTALVTTAEAILNDAKALFADATQAGGLWLNDPIDPALEGTAQELLMFGNKLELSENEQTHFERIIQKTQEILITRLEDDTYDWSAHPLMELHEYEKQANAIITALDESAENREALEQGLIGIRGAKNAVLDNAKAQFVNKINVDSITEAEIDALNDNLRILHYVCGTENNLNTARYVEWIVETHRIRSEIASAQELLEGILQTPLGNTNEDTANALTPDTTPTLTNINELRENQLAIQILVQKGIKNANPGDDTLGSAAVIVSEKLNTAIQTAITTANTEFLDLIPHGTSIENLTAQTIGNCNDHIEIIKVVATEAGPSATYAQGILDRIANEISTVEEATEVFNAYLGEKAYYDSLELIPQDIRKAAETLRNTWVQIDGDLKTEATNTDTAQTTKLTQLRDTLDLTAETAIDTDTVYITEERFTAAKTLHADLDDTDPVKDKAAILIGTYLQREAIAISAGLTRFKNGSADPLVDQFVVTEGAAIPAELTELIERANVLPELAPGFTAPALNRDLIAYAVAVDTEQLLQKTEIEARNLVFFADKDYENDLTNVVAADENVTDENDLEGYTNTLLNGWFAPFETVEDAKAALEVVNKLIDGRSEDSDIYKVAVRHRQLIADTLLLTEFVLDISREADLSDSIDVENLGIHSDHVKTTGLRDAAERYLTFANAPATHENFVNEADETLYNLGKHLKIVFERLDAQNTGPNLDKVQLLSYAERLYDEDGTTLKGGASPIDLPRKALEVAHSLEFAAPTELHPDSSVSARLANVRQNLLVEYENRRRLKDAFEIIRAIESDDQDLFDLNDVDPTASRLTDDGIEYVNDDKDDYRNDWLSAVRTIRQIGEGRLDKNDYPEIDEDLNVDLELRQKYFAIKAEASIVNTVFKSTRILTEISDDTFTPVMGGDNNDEVLGYTIAPENVTTDMMIAALEMHAEQTRAEDRMGAYEEGNVFLEDRTVAIRNVFGQTHQTIADANALFTFGNDAFAVGGANNLTQELITNAYRLPGQPYVGAAVAARIQLIKAQIITDSQTIEALKTTVPPILTEDGVITEYGRNRITPEMLNAAQRVRRAAIAQGHDIPAEATALLGRHTELRNLVSSYDPTDVNTVITPELLYAASMCRPNNFDNATQIAGANGNTTARDRHAALIAEIDDRRQNIGNIAPNTFNAGGIDHSERITSAVIAQAELLEFLNTGNADLRARVRTILEYRDELLEALNDKGITDLFGTDDDDSPIVLDGHRNKITPTLIDAALTDARGSDDTRVEAITTLIAADAGIIGDAGLAGAFNAALDGIEDSSLITQDHILRAIRINTAANLSHNPNTITVQNTRTKARLIATYTGQSIGTINHADLNDLFEENGDALSIVDEETNHITTELVTLCYKLDGMAILPAQAQARIDAIKAYINGLETEVNTNLTIPSDGNGFINGNEFLLNPAILNAAELVHARNAVTGTADSAQTAAVLAKRNDWIALFTAQVPGADVATDIFLQGANPGDPETLNDNLVTPELSFAAAMLTENHFIGADHERNQARLGLVQDLNGANFDELNNDDFDDIINDEGDGFEDGTTRFLLTEEQVNAAYLLSLNKGLIEDVDIKNRITVITNQLAVWRGLFADDNDAFGADNGAVVQLELEHVTAELMFAGDVMSTPMLQGDAATARRHTAITTQIAADRARFTDNDADDENIIVPAGFIEGAAGIANPTEITLDVINAAKRIEQLNSDLDIVTPARVISTIQYDTQLRAALAAIDNINDDNFAGAPLAIGAGDEHLLVTPSMMDAVRTLGANTDKERAILALHAQDIAEISDGGLDDWFAERDEDDDPLDLGVNGRNRLSPSIVLRSLRLLKNTTGVAQDVLERATTITDYATEITINDDDNFIEVDDDGDELKAPSIDLTEVWPKAILCATVLELDSYPVGSAERGRVQALQTFTQQLITDIQTIDELDIHAGYFTGDGTDDSPLQQNLLGDEVPDDLFASANRLHTLFSEANDADFINVDNTSFFDGTGWTAADEDRTRHLVQKIEALRGEDVSDTEEEDEIDLDLDL